MACECDQKAGETHPTEIEVSNARVSAPGHWPGVECVGELPSRVGRRVGLTLNIVKIAMF